MLIEVPMRNHVEPSPYMDRDSWDSQFKNMLLNTDGILTAEPRETKTTIDGTDSEIYRFIDCTLPDRNHLYINLTYEEFRIRINA